MIDYEYSVVNDMSGICTLNLLHAEIALTPIGVTFDGLRRDGDAVRALFTLALTPAEKVTLDTTIAAHGS